MNEKAPFTLALDTTKSPEVQIEALRTMRSMHRWATIKEIAKVTVVVIAMLGTFAIACWGICG